MLLFIPAVWRRGIKVRRFNTSHVTLYQISSNDLLPGWSSFNTSHVTLYPGRGKELPIPPIRFNTSHVTLYLSSSSSCPISSAVSIHLMLLFIFRNPLLAALANSCFNTSHVTLYRVSIPGIKSEQSCFNTSHVTLYQVWALKVISETNVSIHLMLLFIWMQRFSSSSCRAFQYISCYSLSYIKEAVTAGAYKFQYISCYSLSQTPEGIVSSYSSFNTSHVTLYRGRVVLI